MTSTRALAIGALAMIAAGCAPTQEASKAVPEYLLAEQSCAVFVKGMAPLLSEVNSERMETVRFWSMANNAIVDRMNERLTNGHRLVLLEVSYAQASRTASHLANTLARHRCNRLIQLRHKVDQDSGGPYFEFTVSVSRASGLRQRGDGYTDAIVDEQYRKSYRFARTVEVLNTLSVGELAAQMVSEMEQAGSLVALRR